MLPTTDQPAMGSSDSTVSILQQGDNFANRFLVRSLLGVGGMGEVYLADDSFLNQQVALKVMRSDFLTNESMKERFFREIRLTRLIANPHVVRTFECDSFQGSPFFTMEFVEGCTLKDWSMQKSSGFEQLVGIVYSLAIGLQAIHAQSIIHRDLKPANILLGTDGLVRISDFGVARPFDSSLTKTSEVVGTGAYLAPELWMSGEADVRSDIYALGVLAYEVTTGSLPFNSDSSAQLMYAHLETKPKDISSIDKTVPSWWSSLVTKMLEKDPADRLQTAGDVIDYIDAHTEDDPRLALSSDLPSADELRNRLVSFKNVPSYSTKPLLGETAVYFRRQRVFVGILVLLVLVLLIGVFNRLPPLKGQVETDIPRFEGLLGHFDPQQLHSIGIARVSEWLSNAGSFSQVDSLKQPTIRAEAINERAAVVFDGVDDYLSLDNPNRFTAGIKGVSFIFVARTNGAARNKSGRHYLFALQGFQENDTLFQFGFDAKNRLMASVGQHRKKRFSAPVPAGSFAVYSITLGKDSYLIRRNSQRMITKKWKAEVNFAEISSISIGQEYDRFRPSDFLNGEVAYMIVYDRELQIGELESIERALYDTFDLDLQ